MKDVLEEISKRPKRKFTRNEVLASLLCIITFGCIGVIAVYFLDAISNP